MLRRYAEVLVLALAAAPSLATQSFPRALSVAAAAASGAVLLGGLARVAEGRPLLYWAAVALPAGLWASPLLWEVSWPFAARLLWSMAVAFHVAGKLAGKPGSGPWLLRAYLASGVAVALFRASFHDNELAGVLTLYLPLTVALSLSPFLDSRPVRRLQLLLLTALFGLLLAGTGSRGGILSTALALVLVLGLFGRRGRVVLAVGGVAALAAAGFAGFGRIVDVLIFSGSAQGFSLAVVTSGRPQIWRRALAALGDFPLTGLGPGAFGPSAGVLYPGAPEIEDAHDLFLETALGLGVPAAAAFVAFLALLARRLLADLRRAPRRGPRFARLLGLLGALAAHLIYSLGDSVSPGSAGNVFWWFLCGLTLASTRDRGATTGRRRLARAFAVVVAVSALCLLPALHHNRAAVAAARALVGGGDRDRAAALLDADRLCRARWPAGLLAADPDQRRTEWSELIRCSPGYFDLLQAAAADDRRLAELAVAAWDGRGEAHFWLARVLARRPEGRRDAVVRYRRGLDLAPEDARAWLELGNLLAEDRPEEALEAYGEACRRGDPGANACVRAGATAERLGDVDAAVRWYLTSRWAPSRRRAHELDP